MKGYEDPIKVIEQLIAQNSEEDDPFESQSVEIKLVEEYKVGALQKAVSKHHESSIGLRASFVSALADESVDWSLQKA